VDVPIVGDAKNILIELLEQLKKSADTSEWLKHVEGLKKNTLYVIKIPAKIKPQYVIEQIWEATQGEAIITTEVGQNQMWGGAVV